MNETDRKMSPAAAEARREYARRYRTEHRDKIRAYAKGWRLSNPDKVAKYQANYWEKQAQEAEGRGGVNDAEAHS